MLGEVHVVIPTLDEADAIGPVVRRCLAVGVAGVIVADGGSGDGTKAAAEAAGARVLDAGRGYGRACLAGAMAAPAAAILVFMDGDGADRPEAIPTLVGPLAAGSHDFVIASRTRGRRAPGSMLWHQVLAGRLAGLAVRGLYGVAYTDMCALRALRRTTLLQLGLREMTYGWNIEMQMRAASRGLRILEVPVDYDARQGGSSKVAGSLRGTLQAGGRIATTLIKVAAGR